jgi:hypothetical protein
MKEGESSIRSSTLLKQENERLSAEVGRLCQELSSLDRKAQNVSSELKQKVAEIETAQRREKEIDEDHSVVLTKLHRKLADAARSSSRLLAQNKDLTISVRKLERDLSVLTKTKSTLKAENDRLVSDNASLKSALANSTDRNESLTRELDRISGFANVREVQRENEKLVAIVVEAQNQLMETRLQNSKLVSQIADKLSLQGQVEALHEENDALRQEVTKRSSDYNSLLEDLNNSRDIEDSATRNQLEQQLSAEKASNEELRKIVDIVVDQNKALRQSVSHGSKNAQKDSDEEFSAALSDFSKSAELKLVVENEDLKKQIKALEEERLAEQTENTRLKERCARLQKVANSPNRKADVYSAVLAENEELTEENVQLKELVAVLHKRHSIDAIDDDEPFPSVKTRSNEK